MPATTNRAPGFDRNPDKAIAVDQHAGEVSVYAGDTLVARTKRAKVLTEPPYPARYYIPFEDIRMAMLVPTAHSTHCPYKGDASYWTVKPAGEGGFNAMWAYERPYDEMTAIAGHAAFDRDKVRIVAG
ncbi:MAG: DUF427 domain-containing protein [Rhizobiaceae bacterium]